MTSVQRNRPARYASSRHSAVLSVKFSHTLNQGVRTPTSGNRLRKPAVKNVWSRYSSRQCFPQSWSSRFSASVLKR